MPIVHAPVTGQETTADCPHPYTALVNFYSAFNRKDLQLMQTSWLNNEQASMSNPLGGIKRGWEEIRNVYNRIFNGPASAYVEFYDYSIHATETMFLAVGRERGLLEIDNKQIELAIRTTRIYILHDNLWQQIHHHGSMDDPELLATYQAAVLNE